MQEIEIKAVLKDRAGVMERLSALGCTFAPPEHQDDQVYIEDLDAPDLFAAGKIFLRLRTKSDGTILFTAKQRSAPLVALEHESSVGSADAVEQIVLMLGYQKFLRIRKMRQTTHYNDCEICIDEVEGLGTFIEMEKLSAEGNAEEIQEELFKFFETLGIERSDRITKGYDILMFEKQRS